MAGVSHDCGVYEQAERRWRWGVDRRHPNGSRHSLGISPVVFPLGKDLPARGCVSGEENSPCRYEELYRSRWLGHTRKVVSV
jgi:hypothetical protein